jgi:chromosome partitioning protein
VAGEVRRHFGDLVFDAVVPRSVRLAEAPSHGLPITAYDPRSRGAGAYYRVASELVDRMKANAPAAGDRARDEAYV